MAVTVLLFGPLADIARQSSLEIDAPADTDALQEGLWQRYPPFRQQSFALAVDKKIIDRNTPLSHASVVALLPPFSGG